MAKNPDQGLQTVSRSCQFFPFLCPGKIFACMVTQRINTMEEKEMTQNPETTDTMGGMELNTDENAAGTSHLNEPVAEESVLDKLEAEVKEQKDKYLRLMAEFDNYRRRTAKERQEFMQTAGKEVIVALLDVLDDCDRAEKQLGGSDDITTQKEGIQLVFNKLRSTLQSKGVTAMESINTEFDVEKHEAITEVPAPGMEGKVIDEVVKGYYLNDKLVRFAKVVVGK
jgi:molecular chaperone GrpE